MDTDTRIRICAAADQLYAEGGQGKIPNVDAVRRRAKANMNDACAAMKEWRQALLAKAAPAPLVLPEAVQQAFQAGLEHLWLTAQESANQHLRTAQVGWNQERSDNDTVCQQLSKAFDDEALLCSEQQRQLQALRDEIQAMVGVRQAAELAAATSEAGRADATGRAERAEARASGQEQRATDLKEQLACVSAALVQAQQELERVHQYCETTLEDLRGQLAEAQRQARVPEQRAGQAEALASDLQRQVATLTSELVQARDEVAKGRQAVSEAQTAAAIHQGERNTMAANLAQVLAAFKSGKSASGLRTNQTQRKPRKHTKPDGDATQ